MHVLYLLALKKNTHILNFIVENWRVTKPDLHEGNCAVIILYI